MKENIDAQNAQIEEQTIDPEVLQSWCSRMGYSAEPTKVAT